MPLDERHVAAQVFLASASPQRKRFLERLGLRFEAMAADIDESVAAGEDPKSYVLRLARQKTERVLMILAEQASRAVVVGADTCVTAGGVILGKPRSREEARRMIGFLSGRTHQVLTAVNVASATSSETRSQRSEVSFAELSEERISGYLDTGEYEGRAGAYAIQGRAMEFVTRLDGSYSCVVGLPMDSVIELLREFKVATRDYHEIARNWKSEAGGLSDVGGNFWY